jgi:hypothetical protein
MPRQMPVITAAASAAGEKGSKRTASACLAKLWPTLSAAVAGTKPGSSNPVTQSLLDFFDDITEGARDGPRRRAAQLQVTCTITAGHCHCGRHGASSHCMCT